MSNKIMVSVLCTAYNHEKYIRQCLDGFIMQKTNFTYEVIIHDDASTDRTVDIIREYEAKYPNIIKPIYQTENQYSQHIPITKNYLLPKVQGKYLAWCEGDDYWTDEYKLQKQYDLMEMNPDCHMCVHRVQDVNEDGSLADMQRPWFALDSGIVAPRNFVYYVAVYHVPFQTSSVFARTTDYQQYLSKEIKFRNISNVGDFPLHLYFGQLGNNYYLDDTMSCYREMSIGSWSERYAKGGKERERKQTEINIGMLKAFDKYTNGQYHDIIAQRTNPYDFSIFEEEKNYKAMLQIQYRKYLRTFPIKRRLFVFLQAYFPHTYPLTHKVYKKIKSLI